MFAPGVVAAWVGGHRKPDGDLNLVVEASLQAAESGYPRRCLPSSPSAASMQEQEKEERRSRPSSEEEVERRPSVPSSPCSSAGPTDKDACIICLHRRRVVAIIPCGHLCACEQCLPGLHSMGEARCPVCRAPVASTLR